MQNTQKAKETGGYSRISSPGSISKYLSSRPASGKGSSNYPYAVTRIRAMKTNLFPRDAYPRFLNMSLDEMTRKIGESVYKQDIDDLSREYSGINLVEHALNRNMANTFQKVLRITEGEPHKLVREYLRVFDIEDIKTILRGKLHDIPEEQILQSLVTEGVLCHTYLSNLATKTTDEIIASLTGTMYAPILEKFDGTNFTKIEDELDKFYYTNLFETIGYPRSTDRRQLKHFVQKEIDIKNLCLLLRVKKYEAIGSSEDDGTRCIIEDVSSMMIPNGLSLNTDKLINLSYEDFVEALRSTPYWAVISSDLENKDIKSVSLTDVETHLLRYNLTYVTKNSRLFLLSIIPILEFIIYKSNEVRNLRIIVRGKSVGMSNDAIKEKLVIL